MKIMNSADSRFLAPRMIVIASLGLAGLLGLAALGTSHRDVAPARDDAVSAPPAKAASVAGSQKSFRYIRTGRWQADARTFTAIVRYLLDPEIEIKPSGALPSLQLTMPTNVVSTTPLPRGTS